MGRDYFPSSDQEYRTWLTNFVTQLIGNAAQVGLVQADIDPLAAANDLFDASLTNHISARTAARAASSKKFTDRESSEQILRPLVQRISKHPGMTDALRSILGLPVHHGSISATGLEELTPLLNLETGKGCVVVHWGPEPGNERINGKPAGVWAASIYRKKIDEDQYTLVGVSSASPYIDPITGPASDYIYTVQYRGTQPEDVSQPSNPQVITAGGLLAA